MKKIVLVIMLILLVSCSSEAKIGAILPLSGGASFIGQAYQEGIDLALQNSTFQVVYEDSQSDPKQALTAYEKLKNDNIRIYMTGLTAVSLALVDRTEADGNLLFADGSHPVLTEDRSTVLRHLFTIGQVTDMLAELVDDNRQAALFILQDDYGVTFAEQLQSKTFALQIEYIDGETLNFRTQLLKVLKNNPDYVIIESYTPNTLLLLKQLKELGYGGTVLLGISSSVVGDINGLLKENYPSSKMIVFPDMSQYQKDYKTVFGDEPANLGFIAFTTTELLLYAIQKTRSTDPQILHDYIVSLEEFEGKYETVKILENGDILPPLVVVSGKDLT